MAAIVLQQKEIPQNIPASFPELLTLYTLFKKFVYCVQNHPDYQKEPIDHIIHNLCVDQSDTLIQCLTSFFQRTLQNTNTKDDLDVFFWKLTSQKKYSFEELHFSDEETDGLSTILEQNSKPADIDSEQQNLPSTLDDEYLMPPYEYEDDGYIIT